MWACGRDEPALFGSRANCQTCQSKVICYAAHMPRSVGISSARGSFVVACWAAFQFRPGVGDGALVVWQDASIARQFGGSAATQIRFVHPCARALLSTPFPFEEPQLDRCNRRLCSNTFWFWGLENIPNNIGAESKAVPWCLPQIVRPI